VNPYFVLNEVSIFLFRFELRSHGIDFVLNEAIAEDMYPDIDEKMKPLVHACCETLLRYRHLSVNNTIMDRGTQELKKEKQRNRPPIS
jgi:hypothetical protein